MYPQIKLQPHRETALSFHHPWIFSRAVAKIPEKLENGSVVEILSHDGQSMGMAYYNRHSQIALRMLSFFETINVDQNFFEERFRKAFAMREKFLDFKNTNAYRLVFAESDGLPGLIVDRYDQFLVVQIHTLGMDKLKALMIPALVKVFQPQGIYERSDIEVRKKEGLKDTPSGVLFGQEPPDLYEIQEHGLKFFVDIKHGQKTGFFLDQRENRKAIQAYVRDKKILNLFSYSGGFSLAALKGGAQKITSIDISSPALTLAKKNFQLNGFSPEDHDFLAQDVFSYLDECIEKKQQFEVVIVDPPAFVKSRESLNNAVNAYIRLNEKALKILKPGGILVSSSCSSHVTSEMFRTILFKAGLKAHADLVILENKLQAFDHPLRIHFPEGEYLKFFICLKV